MMMTTNHHHRLVFSFVAILWISSLAIHSVHGLVLEQGEDHNLEEDDNLFWQKVDELVVSQDHTAAAADPRDLGLLLRGRDDRQHARCQRNLLECQAEPQELPVQEWLEEMAAMQQEQGGSNSNQYGDVLKQISEFLVLASSVDVKTNVETLLSSSSSDDQDENDDDDDLLNLPKVRGLILQLRSVQLPPKEGATPEQVESAITSFLEMASDDSTALFFFGGVIFAVVVQALAGIWIQLIGAFFPVFCRVVVWMILLIPRLWCEFLVVLLGLDRRAADQEKNACLAELIQCRYKKWVRDMASGFLEIVATLTSPELSGNLTSTSP